MFASPLAFSYLLYVKQPVHLLHFHAFSTRKWPFTVLLWRLIGCCELFWVQPGSPFTCAAVPTPSVCGDKSLVLRLTCLSLKMAAAATISVDEDHFCCPVCLEVLKDPVTIPCGHSYCMECIKGYWKKTEHKTGYACPQCRQAFNTRPALARNTVLAGLVEKLREKLRDAGIQEAPHAKTVEVECDECQGRKHRAVKSCVKCLGSYCEVHLKQHKTHKLTDVTRQLHKRVCNRHGRLFELYCRTDQQLICPHCVKDGHGGHHTVSAVEERTEKQVSGKFYTVTQQWLYFHVTSLFTYRQFSRVCSNVTSHFVTMHEWKSIHYLLREEIIGWRWNVPCTDSEKVMKHEVS